MNAHTSKIKVSVTVPVYNTSKYLRQCLDSLKVQSLQEIEFILVNDGSTDGSGDICDEYARHNPKFKVIHQTNAGLAVAPQIGLDHAKGEYVIVCDSDDWVEPEMYETLYKAAANNNADIAMCDYWNEYPYNISSIVTHKISEFTKNKEKYLLINPPGGLWKRLIRRSFFTASGVKYEPGIDLGEDLLINYKLFKFNPSFVYVPIAFYHYRRRIGETSYTNNIKTEYVYQRHYVHQWLKENYPEDLYLPYVLIDAIDTLIICSLSEKTDKTFFARFIKENLSWKTLFRLIKNKLAIRMMFIKLFPLPIKIYLTRILFISRDKKKYKLTQISYTLISKK